MIDFQLAPCIIAGLLVVTGYMFTRWLSNLGELKHWKAVVAIGWRHNDELSEEIAAMKAEGCAAMGALQNIFNGVTAGGMPRSKLVRKVADVATDALLLCAPCDHKEEVDDLREALVEAEVEVEYLAGELRVARRDSEGWHNLAVESEAQAERLTAELAEATAAGIRAAEEQGEIAGSLRARAEEAERLLGLANDRLIVERSRGRIL